MIRSAVLLAAVAALLGASTAHAAFPPIDLSAAGTTVTSGVDGTIWTNTNLVQSAGTGVLDPFLRIQANNTETGMNTDAQTPPDDTKAGIWTHSITVGDLQVVTKGGIDYYVFSLDINEPNNDPDRFLSIDSLAIFGQTGSDPSAPVDLNKNNITSLADVDLFPNLEIVYRLGIANTLILDYSLFAGSGLGYDMALLIPVTEFANLATDSRLVFAVGYGGAGGTVLGSGAADGFEEWAFLPGAAAVVPEPGVLALLAIALFAAGAALRRTRK